MSPIPRRPTLSSQTTFSPSTPHSRITLPPPHSLQRLQVPVTRPQTFLPTPFPSSPSVCSAQSSTESIYETQHVLPPFFGPSPISTHRSSPITTYSAAPAYASSITATTITPSYNPFQAPQGPPRKVRVLMIPPRREEKPYLLSIRTWKSKNGNWDSKADVEMGGAGDDMVIDSVEEKQKSQARTGTQPAQTLASREINMPDMRSFWGEMVEAGKREKIEKMMIRIEKRPCGCEKGNGLEGVYCVFRNLDREAGDGEWLERNQYVKRGGAWGEVCMAKVTVPVHKKGLKVGELEKSMEFEDLPAAFLEQGVLGEVLALARAL